MALLSREPLQLAELIAQVSSPERGAIATFLGLVRNHHDGKGVLELGYSAYDAMAESVALELLAEAESKWPVRVALRHRIGRLEIGEVAVAIAVAGAHRDEAFSACRFVIEALKQRVPIWKQERYSDGSVDWVDPTGQGAGDREQGAGKPA